MIDGVAQTLSLSSILIVGAVGTYVIGLLCRDQLHIRTLIVIGSLFYGIYYWIVPATPLWDAILGTVLIGVASLQGVVQILWSRSVISAPQESRQLLRQLGDIEPGLFRRLLRIGERIEVWTPMRLTDEGARPDSLWLLVDGEIELTRQDHATTRIAGPCFVGEIAWLTGSGASATVTALPGAEVQRWRHDALRRRLRRSHRLELALDALIAQDLARKLARSMPVIDPVAGGGDD